MVSKEYLIILVWAVVLVFHYPSIQVLVFHYPSIQVLVFHYPLIQVLVFHYPLIQVILKYIFGIILCFNTSNPKIYIWYYIIL